VKISRILSPVVTLGWGRRLVVWTQGCAIGCPGCCSRDTWSRDDGEDIDPKDIAALIDSSDGAPFDGLSISGGEPFDQPEALLTLLDAIEHRVSTMAVPFDVVVFSGYPEARIKRDFPTHLAKIDLLVAEPYVHKLQSTSLRGSSNQRLLKLSPLAEVRYSEEYLAQQVRKPSIQVMSDQKALLMVGIPRRGDLERIEVLARERGLNLGESSWA